MGLMRALASFVGLVCAVATLPACSGDEPGAGAVKEPAAGPGSASGDDRGDGLGDDRVAAPGEIVVAMRPVESGPAPRDVVRVEGELETARVVVESTIGLAVGEGYPSRFQATLSDGFLADCGLLNGELVLRELEAEPGAIEASLDPAGAISFAVRDAGVLTAVVRGELVVEHARRCPVTAGAAVPVELRLTVRAARPVGTRFELPSRCSEAAVPRVATSTLAASPDPFDPPSELRVVLADEAGQDFHAANAAPDAPITVRARGAFGASPSGVPPQKLSDLVYPATRGRVELAPAVGAPLTVEVVDASQITGAEIDFLLANDDFGATPVTSGQTYGEQGWKNARNKITPRVRLLSVGADQLCSPPSLSWFELRSLTPDVCEVVSLGPDGGGSYTEGANPTGSAARLLRDGTCSLTLAGPGIPQGSKLAGALEATFVNVQAFPSLELP
jgi:hypothetical protein